MDFDYGDHKLTVLPKSRAVILTYPSKPHLSGVYIQKYDTVRQCHWHHGLSRQFEDMMEYIAKGDFVEYCGKLFQRKTWLNVCNCGERDPTNRNMVIQFYPWTDICDQTYVEFVRISDFYVDAVRLAQHRIHNTPRRLAIAMSLHSRLGAGSLFKELMGEHVLRIVMDACV